jgi:uncharacterized protein YllA (UPF0747 family)
VILRGLMQETLLPNIAFIGGGGETAYWLELKGLFEHYKVPFPVLVLRNSFLIVEKKWKEKTAKAGLNEKEIFKKEELLLNEFVQQHSEQQLSLKQEIADAEKYYGHIKALVQKVDNTLVPHTEALKIKAIKPLHELEKKLLRAEKRKFDEQRKHIHNVTSALFPLNSLQERIENFLPYYAKWGAAFIIMLHKNSLTLEQEFVIVTED